MKVTYPLLVVLGFSSLGYLFYPTLSGVRPQPKPAALAADGSGSAIDPAKIAVSDFPAKVVLKVPVIVYSKDRQTSLELPVGQSVTPVRMADGLLVVQPGTSPLEGEVAVAGTDFLEKVAALLAARAGQPTSTPSAPEEVVPTEVLPTEPETMPVIDPVVDPVAVDPAPEPSVPVSEPSEPTVEPSAPVVDEPAAAVDPAAPRVSGPRLEPTALVAAMQASVAGGAVTEFKAADVSDWQATEDELIDGQTYQTGLAVYQTSGPFGVSTVRAKALILDGRVVKWIGAKSGLELK